MTSNPTPSEDAGKKLSPTPDFYCSYCDDFADRFPCDRCGHRALPMTPVRDAYLLAGRIALEKQDKPNG